jgi:hypothetical protein
MDKYEVTFQDGSKGVLTQEQIDGIPPESISNIQLATETPIVEYTPEVPQEVTTITPEVPQTVDDLIKTTQDTLAQYQKTLETMRQSQTATPGINAGAVPPEEISRVEQEILTWQSKLDYLNSLKTYEQSIKDAETKSNDPNYVVDKEQLKVAQQNLADATKYAKNLIDPKIAPYVPLKMGSLL